MPRYEPKPVDTQEAWEQVIEAASRIQEIFPQAVLVGGTASAPHGQHRFSADDDHVINNLIASYESVVERLKNEAGRVTNRVAPPKMILGNFYGVQTGIRNLIRAKPLEVTTYQSSFGPIVLPTISEMVRVKGYLFVRRNATRDIVDFVALTDRIRELENSDAVRSALAPLDDFYPQQNGESVTRQLALQLANPKPHDQLLGDDLSKYRVLDGRYRSWEQVRTKSLQLGSEIERYRLTGFVRRQPLASEDVSGRVPEI